MPLARRLAAAGAVLLLLFAATACSGDETADIGRDTASPVSDDYQGETSVLTGTVAWVRIDLGENAADADHFISPEERLQVLLARQ